MKCTALLCVLETSCELWGWWNCFQSGETNLQPSNARHNFLFPFLKTWHVGATRFPPDRHEVLYLLAGRGAMEELWRVCVRLPFVNAHTRWVTVRDINFSSCHFCCAQTISVWSKRLWEKENNQSICGNSVTAQWAACVCVSPGGCRELVCYWCVGGQCEKRKIITAWQYCLIITGLLLTALWSETDSSVSATDYEVLIKCSNTCRTPAEART